MSLTVIRRSHLFQQDIIVLFHVLSHFWFSAIYARLKDTDSRVRSISFHILRDANTDTIKDAVSLLVLDISEDHGIFLIPVPAIIIFVGFCPIVFVVVVGGSSGIGSSISIGSGVSSGSSSGGGSSGNGPEVGAMVGDELIDEHEDRPGIPVPRDERELFFGLG